MNEVLDDTFDQINLISLASDLSRKTDTNKSIAALQIFQSIFEEDKRVGYTSHQIAIYNFKMVNNTAQE